MWRRPCSIRSFQTISLSQYRVRRPLAALACAQWPQFAGSTVIDTQAATEPAPPAVQGKYVVLFFYPLDFTFVCPTEITAFSDRHAEFAKLNCEVRAAVPSAPAQQPRPRKREPHPAPQVLGVSVDSPFSHLAWCQTGARPPGGTGPTLAGPGENMRGRSQTARRAAWATSPTPSSRT